MSVQAGIGRREFVEASVALAGCLLLSGCDSNRVELSSGWRDFLAQMQGAAAAGRWLTENRPLDGELLLTRLTHQFGPEGPASPGVVKEMIVKDFAAGRLCSVDEWQMSQTECDLMQLRYLALGSLETDQIAIPWGFEHAAIGEVVEVRHWGPQSTYAGEGFNIQGDGHFGMWFQSNEPPRGLKVFVDGEEVPTTINSSIFTIGLYEPRASNVVAEVGQHEIWGYDEVRNIKQKIGEFTVLPERVWHVYPDGTTSAVFCEVGLWGPSATEPGVAFNVQPNGNAAFWVRIPCAPATAILELGGNPLPTKVHAGLVTANLPDSSLYEQPSVLELTLFDSDSGERLVVGEFLVAKSELTIPASPTESIP